LWGEYAMAEEMPDLDLISLPGESGIWFDPRPSAGERRYLTTEAAANRTGLTVDTFRDHRDTEGLLLAVDRGEGSRPRFVYPESKIERLRVEVRSGPSEGDSSEPGATLSVQTMLDELVADVTTLRAEKASWVNREREYRRAISKLEEAQRLDARARLADVEAREAIKRAIGQEPEA
jgi:hypothetical protein